MRRSQGRSSYVDAAGNICLSLSGSCRLFFSFYSYLHIPTHQPRQQNISQDLIKQQIVCSDLDKIKQYDEMVRGYFEKMENNQKQIITLTETRDGLLPRLMSGDVKI